jgi:hypothetical protein
MMVNTTRRSILSRAIFYDMELFSNAGSRNAKGASMTKFDLITSNMSIRCYLSWEPQLLEAIILYNLQSKFISHRAKKSQLPTYFENVLLKFKPKER